MKNSIIYIILIIVCSILIIYKYSPIGQVQQSNAFKRNFIPSKVMFEKAIRLPNHLFGFAGKLDKDIVLKSYSEQLPLFKINYALNKLDTISLTYPPAFRVTTNIYKNFESSNIYFTNPYSDISIYNGYKSILFNVSGLRFDNFQPISSRTLIVRARHSYKKQLNRALVKLVLSDHVSVDKKYLLPKQVNGFFTNDGWLHYDKKSARVLYMYFYRGEFLNLDTNLNLLYVGKTIDTVRIAKIKTDIITVKTTDGRGVKEITPTIPPRFINTYITTHNDCIYILSALESDNKISYNYTRNQAVDVYRIRDGKYLHSFYIPKYKGIKVNEFQIKDDTMVAIYGSYLVTYKFGE